MSAITIRPFRREDRQAVREIAWQTAFIGKPADAFFSDKELLQDFLTAYFTDHEPGSCFVAESEGEVVGYLLGAVDEHRLARVSCRYILPGLLARFIFRDLFRRKCLLFVLCSLKSWIRGEFRGEDFSREYPAILHINMREGFQGHGAGSSLMRAYLEYLARAGAAAVHLATMSPKAGVFFEKQGFTLLARHPRSYFRRLTGHDVQVGIYGKKLR